MFDIAMPDTFLKSTGVEGRLAKAPSISSTHRGKKERPSNLSHSVFVAALRITGHSNNVMK